MAQPTARELQIIQNYIEGYQDEPLGDILVAFVEEGGGGTGFATPVELGAGNVFAVPKLPLGLRESYTPDNDRYTVSGTPRIVQRTVHKIKRHRRAFADVDLFDLTIDIKLREQLKPIFTSLELTVGKRLDPRFAAYVTGNLQPGSTLQILTDDELPAGLRITTSVSAGSNRVFISGTPTSPISGRYTFTAQEVAADGTIIRIRGSVTIHIDVRAVDPGPRPAITISPTATKRAGVKHAAFTIATLTSFPTHAVVPEFEVSGAAALGLSASVTSDETKLQLSGTIPRNTAPSVYTLSIRYSEATRAELSALYGERIGGTVGTFFLRVSAAAVTPPPEPVAIQPPYWTGKPASVALEAGTRVSAVNPLRLGSILQVDNLGITFEVISGSSSYDDLPLGITIIRQSSDGQVLLYGTPPVSGNFDIGIRYSVTGAAAVESTLSLAIQEAAASEPEPQPTRDPDEPLPPPRTNAPPTIRVHQRTVEVDVGEPISIKLFTIADPDDVPTSTVAGLPEGLELSITGTLRGTIPTTAGRGAYRVTVTTTDGVNPAVSATATITVRGEVPRIAPPVHSNVADDFSIAQGASGGLKLLVNVKGATSTEVTGLPPDLRTNVVQLIPASNGANVVLLGAVQAEASPRAYRVVVTSTNLGGTTSSEIVIRVTGDTPAPDEDTRGITLREDSYTFIVGQEIRQQIFDATVDITNAGLPAGLSLTPRGALTGTVTAAPGSYVVALTNTAAAVVQSITIIVLAPVAAAPTTLNVFGSRSGTYFFTAPEPIDLINLSTAELTRRTVDTSVALTGWGFGQPSPPPITSSAFTVILNDRPIWLFRTGLHEWHIAPLSVPRSHYNKNVRFALIAQMGDLVQQIDVDIFVQGPGGAPIPTTTTTRKVILEATVPRGQLPQVEGQTKQISVHGTIPDGVDLYGFAWQSPTFSEEGNGAVVDNPPFIFLDYERELDGRYRYNGGRFSVTFRRTAFRSLTDATVSLSGTPVDQEFPQALNLPAVSIRPDSQVSLNRNNIERSFASNRLWLASRNLFVIRPQDISSVEYELEVGGDDIPFNELLVTPKPFAEFSLHDDEIPGPPNIYKPVSTYWFELDAEPSINELGRYNIELTLTRKISRVSTSQALPFPNLRPATGQPDEWEHVATGNLVLRVGQNPAPAPTIENYRGNYRIFINAFWESEPFQAFNESDDPIEVTFVNAPEGLNVTEDIDGWRFNWTPTRAQAGTHEIEVHVTAHPGVVGVATGTTILTLTIDVVTNKGHITQIENPSSIREFGEFFLRTPSMHNYQFLQYGLRSRHVVPPRTLQLTFPIDHQPNDLWREVEPGNVIDLNIFGLTERPALFVVDKVTLQDLGFGTAFKRVWLTEQRVQPEGWYKGKANQADGSFTNFDTLFTSNRLAEIRGEGDDKFFELIPSIREVLLVTVEDDGTAQAIITGDPRPFYPDNNIQLRIGDYVSSGPAEITPTSLTWNGTTTVPTFGDTEEVIIEAIPDAVVPHIVAVEDDEEAIFEAGITFNGRLRTNPGVLRGRYLVIRHVNTLVAYNEATGELWDAESGVLLGTTITGQSAITSVRLEGRKRDSLLIRGSEDYELLL